MRERLSSLARPSVALLCGFLGALLFASCVWAYNRYAEFVVIRQVVGQAIEQQNRAAQKPADKP